MPDDFPLISPSSASDTISSPAESPVTTSPAASAYHLYAAVDGAEPPQTAETVCASWATDLKPNELSLDTLNLLPAYDTIDSGNSAVPNFSGEPVSYDYRLYDSFTFNGIPDETLGSMTGHY